MVLSTSIDKYIYVTVKRQLNIVEHKYRISWSKVEFKDRIDDIEHPIVRETLKIMDIDFPLEITTFADVPANTGLGSSSSFTVGLLHALFALKGKMVTKNTLAVMAAHIEKDILKRNIGSQDHFAAAYGNFNVITFLKNGIVNIEPVFFEPSYKNKIEKNLMLFYTELKRDASEILKKQSDETHNKLEILQKMKGLVEPLRELISSSKNPGMFGEILHQGWLLKKSITDEISSSQVDEYYEKARKAGAIGGKLLGAGGGGFLLLYVEPERQSAVEKALSTLYRMKFKFDDAGSRITYYDQREF
jgi:D-glycero-alpha-D-manno-heptose-7-phosphate kinase